ncbi:MAG: LrgB family protein [Gammaproteobacteria bacterium]|jgi:predicted murein hydrolase (TIGR00659 family)|nr:LrgB family protein [Gammaproteobacteria bacterium]
MRLGELGQVWVYLSASPLLWLSVTLLAYLLAFTLYRKAGDNPLLNPVALAVALLIVILLATGTPYATYFEGAQFVHFLLGPATVALAVPLYRQLGRLRRLWLPVAVAVVVGVTVAALSAVAIAALLGGSVETQLSLAPKSVTAPVAMGIAEKLGGLPSLTAVLVVATGILGAVTGTRLLSWCGVRDDAVRGIAMGVTSHGIGTARAFQVSPAMGAFSGLGMALSAFATALLVPWLVRLLGVSG